MLASVSFLCGRDRTNRWTGAEATELRIADLNPAAPGQLHRYAAGIGTYCTHLIWIFMNLLANLDHRYDEWKRNQWLRYFAVFCRVALALGFIPSGIVKVMGERFTGLPANHPLGHYFDALYLTGFYYRFIGVSQLIFAVLGLRAVEIRSALCVIERLIEGRWDNTKSDFQLPIANLIRAAASTPPFDGELTVGGYYE